MNRTIKRIVASLLFCMMLSGIGVEPITALAGYKVIDYGDGDVYEGNTNAQDDKSGQGTYRCYSGTVITGTWKSNYLTGKGRIVYVDGDRYVGNFKYDEKSGKGKYYFKNGDIYNGSWKNDKMNGKGKYTWKKKWTLTGTWKNGKINGQCVFKNSSYIYNLSVKNGKLQKVISRRKK